MVTREERARRHTEWLREVMRITNKTPTQIANEAKLTPATLTRRIAKPDFPHPMSEETIGKIVARHHVARPDAGAEIVPLPGMREEASPFEHMPDDGEVDRAVRAFTSSRPAAVPWRLKGRALELEGYRPGDVLIVDMNATPKPGEVVCAQRHPAPDRPPVTIFRIYQPPYLIARTIETTLSKPELVDNEQVVIRGTVIAMVRPPQEAA